MNNWQYEGLKIAREVYAAEGRCIDCGEMRGEDGTTRRCRPCANKANAHGLRRKGKKAEVVMCLRCKLKSPKRTTLAGPLCGECFIKVQRYHQERECS